MNPLEESLDWKNFVHNVIWLRESNGLSKREMASILGIGVKTLDRIENGELPKLLSVNIFFHIWKYFGIHPTNQLGNRLGEE